MIAKTVFSHSGHKVWSQGHLGLSLYRRVRNHSQDFGTAGATEGEVEDVETSRLTTSNRIRWAGYRLTRRLVYSHCKHDSESRLSEWLFGQEDCV